jgi:hypothetical protein
VTSRYARRTTRWTLYHPRGPLTSSVHTPPFGCSLTIRSAGAQQRACGSLLAGTLPLITETCPLRFLCAKPILLVASRR